MTGMITRMNAEQLAELMKGEAAYSAEIEEMEVHGVKVRFVILSHDSQMGGQWKSLHVMGEYYGHVNVGVIKEQG